MPREAIAIFERLRSDLPDMFEPYNNLAVLYAEQGRLDEAHDVLMAALERKRDAVAYANLGDVYMRLADRAYSRARNTGAGGPVSQRIRFERAGFSGLCEGGGPSGIRDGERRDGARGDASAEYTEGAAGQAGARGGGTSGDTGEALRRARPGVTGRRSWSPIRRTRGRTGRPSRLPLPHRAARARMRGSSRTARPSPARWSGCNRGARR